MKPDINNLVITNKSKGAIGSLVYFSIPRILLKKELILLMVRKSGINNKVFTSSYNNVFAFKTATSMCIPKDRTEESKYKIRLLENDREGDENLIKREIKREDIKQDENVMGRIGNIWYNKVQSRIYYNLESDANDLDYSIQDDISRAIEVYKKILVSYTEDRLTRAIIKILVSELDASPISAHGNIYFVPEYSKDALLRLEVFFDMLKEESEKAEHNLAKGSAISFVMLPVISEEKYIKEYSREFKTQATKEMEVLEKRLDVLKEEGASDRVIDTISNKLKKISIKISKYAECLNTELDDLDLAVYGLNRQLDVVKNKSIDIGKISKPTSQQINLLDDNI